MAKKSVKKKTAKKKKAKPALGRRVAKAAKSRKPARKVAKKRKIAKKTAKKSTVKKAAPRKKARKRVNKATPKVMAPEISLVEIGDLSGASGLDEVSMPGLPKLI